MIPSQSHVPSDPRALVEIAWRRKWVLLIPLVVFTSAALFLAKSLPSIYRSSTVILVEKPKVPETYVQSTVTTRIEDRLATITQQILSRTRLEAIISQFDLYRDERAAMPMEVIVDRMRHAVEVQVRGVDSFTIFYRGRDPQVVRDVTNELAAVFIEENSKVREEQAASTSEFLENQLAQLKQTLTGQERQVRDFKERYMGELPQQQEANLRALDRLQLQSVSIADQIRAAEQRRLLLQAQLGQIPRFNEVVQRVLSRSGPRTSGPSATPAPAAPPVSLTPERDPLVGRVEEARTTLAQLQARYTDLHPDVVRAKRHLEELEAMVGTRPPRPVPVAAGPRPQASPSASGAEEPDAGPIIATTEVRQIPNPAYLQVDAQMAATEREVLALRESQVQVADQIRKLQRKIENVPELEQQLMELTRDYDNTRRTYESLLSKKLEAQIAENLEKRQKGEQFRVLDPATAPARPHKPNRMLILALGVVLGLGVGVAGAAGLETLDRSVWGASDLRALMPKVRILGVLPVIEEPRQTRRRRLAHAGAGVATALVLGAAFAAAVQYREHIVRLGVLELLLR